MLFNSIKFLLFFPIITIVYFIIPFKQRWKWLLAASFYFYMNWNPKYALLIGFSIIVTYMSGLLIEKEELNKDLSSDEINKKKKLWVFLSFFINLSILFFFKYFNFVGLNITRLFNLFHIGMKVPNLNILLPVGISFYTFQALSYTMDVYRGDIKARKHLGKYALFVSFFPQLVAGPIERSQNLLPQFDIEFKFDYDRMKDGLLLMLWGFFKKIVIADRLAILVNTVYNEPKKYDGMAFIIA
ncbi:MAG: MBOAT family protein, partial [Fusobacteriaceae bacterium]|nr:MBOAT family protein [Fusobacteriaceae bacterium]